MAMISKMAQSSTLAIEGYNMYRLHNGVDNWKDSVHVLSMAVITIYNYPNDTTDTIFYQRLKIEH